MDDLYDFPDNYIGRKTYVHVHGHSRSVPKFKTYLGSDRRNYLLPDFGGDWSALGNQSTYIMPDKAPYVSVMEKGVEITSRSHHREHMRKHGVVEAGDVKLGSMSGIDRAPMTRAGYDIVKAMQGLNR